MSTFESRIMLSNRHIHLSEEVCYALFGEGHKLTPKNELDAAQYAAIETVDVIGPKGKLEAVRVLGPNRKFTQVELLRSDCFKLGVQAPIRESGDLRDAAVLKLVGTVGEVEIPCGIIALRHIHLPSKIAEEHGIQDLQMLSLRVEGERAMTFDNVLVRIGKGDLCVVHLDTEEGNAANLTNGVMGTLIV